MPPWTPRPTANNALNLSSSGTSGRHRSPSRMTSDELLNQAYGIPTLHPSPGSHQKSGSRNTQHGVRHGRSMSHPFPSLFSGKRRPPEESTAVGFDSTDDDVFLPAESPSPLKTGPGKLTRISDKELMTGKCMTCDSMVRWPRELSVFRCTVCLTINDLKSASGGLPQSNRHRRSGSKNGNDFTMGKASYKVPPLSLKKTSALIEHCLKAYLLSQLPPFERDAAQMSVMYGDNEQDSASTLHVSSPIASPQISAVPLTDITDLSSLSITDLSSQTTSKDPKMRFYSSSTPSSHGQRFRPRDQTSLGYEERHTHPTASQPTPSYFTDGAAAEEARIYAESQPQRDSTANIFKELEDYIAASVTSRECINASFLTGRPNLAPRAASEGSRRTQTVFPDDNLRGTDDALSAMDAKTLLIGDFAENGSWWSGSRQPAATPGRSSPYMKDNLNDGSNAPSELVTIKSPKIDWADLNAWYRMVLGAGNDWEALLIGLNDTEVDVLVHQKLSAKQMRSMGDKIMEAQAHTRRVLLKATETLLKRPGCLLRDPQDIRFLIIILANPLLYPSSSELFTARKRSGSRSRNRQTSKSTGGPRELPQGGKVATFPTPSQDRNNGPGQHSGIIKRVVGLLSNLPNECHHHLVSWFSRFSDGQFQRTVELIGSFVTYRLTRQQSKPRSVQQDPTAGLVPSMAASGHGSSAALHAALGVSGPSKKQNDGRPKEVVYNGDWQIKAAARVMALLFSANNSGVGKKIDPKLLLPENTHSAGMAVPEAAHHHSQILATSDFYNTLLDYSDLIADFEAWESKRGKFAFCQYPFFLSIWAKIQIMEYDARRQMEVKAREAFFDSIMTRKTVQQYLILKVRRECLVEDSLKGVSEVVGSGSEEIKKGLRIEFKGEEGIDAGGLRKEWFLLLVRDVFNPEHGMFTYDEDSHFCYFNPNSFETSDQFFLVGVVFGLAIYNSTILDVALPPFAFRKLLAAGPTAAPGAASHAKPSMVYSLDDLAEYRPSLARGLRHLLEYDGDVESTFCCDFVADVERYGQVIQVPLCSNGEKKPVTNSNRREFVDLYVRYLLDTAVSRQFEPFKRGFFTVCGGNALSLFRPEEIELLVRGSDEPLDITSLRAVAICENWGVQNPADTEPVIAWFWQSFLSARPKDQRKLLSFITGSDRIPAMGAANLVIKLSCLGDDGRRFPVARTCFNMLSLWRYESYDKLEKMLWRAVHESEGFGLK